MEIHVIGVGPLDVIGIKTQLGSGLDYVAVRIYVRKYVRLL